MLFYLHDFYQVDHRSFMNITWIQPHDFCMTLYSFGLSFPGLGYTHPFEIKS